MNSFGSDIIKTVFKSTLLIIFAIIIVLSIKMNDKNNDLLVLVNKENPIKTNYDVNLRSYNGKYIAKEVVKPLKQLEKKLIEKKLPYKISDTYVSINYQQKLFDNTIKNYEKKGLSSNDAKLKAANTILLPRYSEHHTGLAIDFECDDELYNWLENNAYEYGFILRYPKGKEKITGYAYDKKHYRYVGMEVARTIYKNRYCLEEYLQNNERKEV